MSIFIKVRNTEGRFSTGGMYIRFTKKGKVWSSLGYLKRHLAQFSENELRKIYKDCTITILDENTLEKSEKCMNDFLDRYITETRDKKAKAEISNLKSMKKLYKDEIDNLILKIEYINEKLIELGG